MKKLINITFGVIVLMINVSCLERGLDELPVYEDAEISNVKFEYRWWDATAKQARIVEIPTSIQIDGETISCTLSVPAANNTFTENVRKNVSLNSLSCSMDISSAARIYPQGNSPVLGVMSDFSGKEYTYKVVAADKHTQKSWTIKIITFNK